MPWTSETAEDLASVLVQRLKPDSKLAIIDFRDGLVGVECQPLSGILADALRSRVTSVRNKFELKFQVIGSGDPSAADAVIVGSWLRDASETISLTIKMGEVGSGEPKDLGVRSPVFELASLPEDGQGCVLSYEMVAKTVQLQEDAVVWAGPSLSAGVKAELKKGEEVLVVAHASGTDWWIVRLAGAGDHFGSESLRRGFVFSRGLIDVPLARGREGEAREASGGVGESAETAAVVPPARPAARSRNDVFKDCEVCPEMVVIPPGEFVMGSPESETTRERVRAEFAERERPQHTVHIEQPFALGKYEVTFAQWDACVAAGGCDGHRPDDEGWGRGARPVINVNWQDAKSYIAWLSAKTGRPYRLPSEAEWEYAARAGTTTARFWGEVADRGCGHANVYDRTSMADEADEHSFGLWFHDCDDGYVNTAPVGSFAANAFGVHDMLGNAWEFVEDCWNDSYNGAPVDGSAWRGGNCDKRIRRGGSWSNVPSAVRAAERFSIDPVRWRQTPLFGRLLLPLSLGFRVARTLD